MITITMTSPKVPGEITFTYNEQNTLSSLLISEPLTEKQYIYLFNNMPWHTAMLAELSAKAPDATFIEKQLEATFDMFWNRYNDKDRSSKKKTEEKWNKMSIANRLKAYLYIPTYNRNRGTAEKKHATTYLAAELWNN